MAAPSVAVYKDAYTAGTSTQYRDLTQITVATGDVCAVVVQTQGYGSSGADAYATGLAKQAGTAAITTPAKPREAGTASHCANGLFTFSVTTGGTLQLRVTWSATLFTGYSTTWTYVATGSGGAGNTAMATTSDVNNQCMASLATSDASYVLALATEWNAIATNAITLTPAGYATPLDAHETDGTADSSSGGSRFSSIGGHWASVSSGSASYGVTAPTSAVYNLVVCELLGAGGTPATVTMGGFLAAPASAPAVQVMNLSGPNYATTATDLGGGAGSWASTGNAGGAPDSSYATWTVV